MIPGNSSFALTALEVCRLDGLHGVQCRHRPQAQTESRGPMCIGVSEIISMREVRIQSIQDRQVILTFVTCRSWNITVCDSRGQTYRIKCWGAPHQLECYSGLELYMGHVLGGALISPNHAGGPAAAQEARQGEKRQGTKRQRQCKAQRGDTFNKYYEIEEVLLKAKIVYQVQVPLWRRFESQVRAGWNDGCQPLYRCSHLRKHHLTKKKKGIRFF